MIVECSNCHAQYNINEKKIPPSGVKVRCSKCQHIIFIKREEPAPSPPEVEKPPEPEMPTPPAPPSPEVVPKPTPPPVAAMSEEDKKWHERAQRLAKALASDLVLYNKDKVEQGLREGTLAQLLGSEIRRSWEYYCQQIPKQIVESTDYFKEKLNEIVGKGKEIFK
jgi:predicted Zn finger-like uncharacterized protein